MPKGIYIRTKKMQTGKYKRTEAYKIKRSKAMKGKNFGKKNSNWKNGKTIHSAGYILIRKNKHPFANNAGYIRRSHLVMEKMIGRYIIPPEEVHHKGVKYPINSIKNKQDDRPGNLQLFDNHKKHMVFEHLFSYKRKSI